MSDDAWVQEQQGRLRRGFDRAMAHPWLAGAGAIASIAALIIVGLQLSGAFSSHATRHLRLGEAGVSGPLTLTPFRLECGRRTRDVRSVEAREILRFAPLQGQLCFLQLRMYNSSDEQSQANGSSNLIVNGKAFAALTTEPVRLPLLFPGEQEVITVIYNLPAGVVPSELTIRAYEPFASTPGYGPYVHYDLSSAI